MFWFGIGYLLEPIIMAVALGLFIAMAPYITRTPRGEKELKFFMFLTIVGYALILFAAYAFLTSYLGYVPSLWTFALILTGIGALQYFIAPFLINIMYRAEPAPPEIQEMVNRLAQRSGLKPPKAMIARVPIPNAFAYGNFLTGRYVALTEGITRTMDEEELEAVIGHELGHHKHNDIWLILALSLAPMFVYYLGRIMMEWGFWGSASERDRENSSLAFLVAGIALVAISFILNFIILQFNRLREYYADLHGAKVKGKKPMQRALARLHVTFENIKSNPVYQKELEQFNESPAKMLFIYAFTQTFASPYYDMDEIIERLKREETNPIMEVFMSHPPIPKRLRFLDNISE
ncbi:protease [Ignicoccus islandicus DSM 13165]|uniref:Protease HtpX homolog n=1 Tax=Ignicoccus islandicus DSM 13165 TaxID=940295 RepID=A0A0U2U7B3_9CREN|nr:zinc metalloprotease HtpX [Ignicoccus islandicus]ALU12020.1 protease [Ignicoccus islandicus DSM 13165]